MPRPPRIEYADAIYHVTSRGARRAAIFADDDDRASLLAVLARTLQSCDARVFAYCLMGNHYHFVLQTRQPNLSTLMHRVNSVYSLTFNRRHGFNGPLFEARFKAAHVDRDGYLLTACRYVDLNPVRAALVESPAQWAWSSFGVHSGARPAPDWLATAELLGILTGETLDDGARLTAAHQRYVEWVEAGRDERLWRHGSHGGRFLGDQGFVDRVMQHTR